MDSSSVTQRFKKYHPKEQEILDYIKDSLRGLVVRVPGYRSRGPGSIPGATRFSEK
jgi:hypothetical protein